MEISEKGFTFCKGERPFAPPMRINGTVISFLEISYEYWLQELAEVIRANNLFKAAIGLNRLLRSPI